MRPDISIVIPVYNEEENIFPLYKKLKNDLSLLRYSFEIIFVDDGSIDGTFNKLKEIQASDKSIHIIKFRRNFGKAISLNMAFRKVKGEIVITMDGDLQDDSGEIENFILKIFEGYDVVSGYKFPRYDPLTKTIPSLIFNKLTSCVSGVKLHDFNCGFKAYRKEVVDALYLYGELHRYTPVLANYYGFKISEIKVKHHPRIYGKSKYGIKRLIKGMLDLITVKFLTSYITRPLHAFGFPGILSITVGVVIGIYLLMLKFTINITLSDRPLLLLSIFMVLLGIQFFSLGLLGEIIISRISRENRQECFIEKYEW